MNGDQLYKIINRTDFCSITDLPYRFQLVSIQLQVEYDSDECGLLGHHLLVSSRELASIFRTASELLKDLLFFRHCFYFPLFFRNYNVLTRTVVAQQVCRLKKDLECYCVR